MSEYAQIGELVIESRNLLDKIKGGELHRMQTEFAALTQSMSEQNTSKLEELDSQLVQMQTEGIDALNGERRYVTTITVNGDKDTFYPVTFKMPSDSESEIQIFRHYSWNRESSDFNTTHVASALVVLRGQAHAWDGDANYLATLVNTQRYRQTVANIGFRAYSQTTKRDEAGANTGYNNLVTGYNCAVKSGFMLRGGKLTYRIISNHPISFTLHDEGELIAHNGASNTNVNWIANTLHVDDVETGDSNNNHSTTYISYKAPEVGA